jgi:glycolate oxidase iron-sulfur subunit
VTPEQLLKEADRCVKCGLCLPHCPTYATWESEAESPRGRISLIQALAAGELQHSSALATHLDRCLSCLACEAACPSGVHYGLLIDAGRTLLNELQPKRRNWRRLFDLLSDRRRLERWRSAHRLLRRAGLSGLAGLIPLARWRRLARMGRQLSEDSRPLDALYPAARPTGRSLQLFVGCITSQTQRELIREAIDLLSGLGYAVEIPAHQGCCGAIHRHNGFPEQAQTLCAANRQLLQRSTAQGLVTLASACHLELTRHLDSPLPVVGLTDFLLAQPLESLSPLRPLKRKVALHVPCSGRDDRSRQLLARIPQIELIDLPRNGVCCGAAGAYLLTQPAISDRLGRSRIEQLRASGAEILVTANTGCALQFRRLIEAADLRVEVLHPAQLFARSLAPDSHRR